MIMSVKARDTCTDDAKNKAATGNMEGKVWPSCSNGSLLFQLL